VLFALPTFTSHRVSGVTSSRRQRVEDWRVELAARMDVPASGLKDADVAMTFNELSRILFK
jgi:hypothetical protein